MHKKRTKNRKKAKVKFEFTAWTRIIDYERNLVSRLTRFACKAFFRMKIDFASPTFPIRLRSVTKTRMQSMIPTDL